MTTSPTFTSSGTRLPLSSMRPGPTATTVPSWGFSLAVSGMTRPEAVGVSASLAWAPPRPPGGFCWPVHDPVLQRLDVDLGSGRHVGDAPFGVGRLGYDISGAMVLMLWHGVR